MQYISPVALLETLTPGQADKKSYSLAKKKLLAELELNGGSYVTVNGQELTRNDIINFFDDLQQADNLSYHTIVANDAVLLRFLEYNFLENGDRFNSNELYSDPGFIDWVSPYFFTSFTSFAEECLAGRNEGVKIVEAADPLINPYANDSLPPRKNDDGWMALSANSIIMNNYYLEKAWKRVEEIIRQDLACLYEYCQAKGLSGKNLIDSLIDFRYVSMLQQLPAERFRLLRDEYAYMMMQCSVHIFNTISQYEGNTIIENSLLLVVSYDVKQSIQAKQVEMHHLTHKAPESKGIGNWSWRIIFFFLFIIFKVATCDSNTSNNYNDDNMRVIYTNPYDSAYYQRLTPQLDSLRDRLQRINLGDTIPATPSKYSPGLDSILRKLKIKKTP